jgi:hypothetical protein
MSHLPQRDFGKDGTIFDLAGEFSLGWARWSGKFSYDITHANVARVAQIRRKSGAKRAATCASAN